MAAMKTYSTRPRDIERRWYVLDAEGAILGRLATEVARILRGKHKPIFAPHLDTGDHVIVLNADKVRLTGGKEQKKELIRHSGYPGGIRRIGYERLMAERPAVAVERAVRGMLPKNRLGRAMFGKLHVYAAPQHPHEAQKPVPLALGQVPKWEGLPTQKPADEVPAAKVPAAKQAKNRKRPGDADRQRERTPRRRMGEARKTKTETARGRPKRTGASRKTKES